MDYVMAMGIPLESVAHIIQVALTPVFLLSGIGGLLNVITSRLGRITDEFDTACTNARSTACRDQSVMREARCLNRRLHMLEASRAFAALAGIATCGATFALFLGALQNTAVATALFLLFGGAVLFTMAALCGFMAEVLMPSGRRLPEMVQDR